MKAAQDGSAFFGQDIQKALNMLFKISNAGTTERHHTRTALRQDNHAELIQETTMQYLIIQLKMSFWTSTSSTRQNFGQQFL